MRKYGKLAFMDMEDEFARFRQEASIVNTARSTEIRELKMLCDRLAGEMRDLIERPYDETYRRKAQLALREYDRKRT